MPQPRSAKKKTRSTGDRGLVLAAPGDVQCNILAERGANKTDGWGLGICDAEWFM